MRPWVLLVTVVGCAADRSGPAVSIPAPIAHALSSADITALTAVLEVSDGDRVLFRSAPIDVDGTELRFSFADVAPGTHTFRVELSAEVPGASLRLLDHVDQVEVQTGDNFIRHGTGAWELPPLAERDADGDGLSNYSELTSDRDPLAVFSAVALPGATAGASFTSGFFALDPWGMWYLGSRSCDEGWSVVSTWLRPCYDWLASDWSRTSPPPPDTCSEVGFGRVAAAHSRAAAAGQAGCVDLSYPDSTSTSRDYRAQATSAGVPVAATWLDVALDRQAAVLALTDGQGLYLTAPDWASENPALEVGAPLPGEYVRVASLDGCSDDASAGAFVAIASDRLAFARLDGATGLAKACVVSLTPLGGVAALAVDGSQPPCRLFVASGTPLASRIEEIAVTGFGPADGCDVPRVLSQAALDPPAEGLVDLAVGPGFPRGAPGLALWVATAGEIYARALGVTEGESTWTALGVPPSIGAITSIAVLPDTSRATVPDDVSWPLLVTTSSGLWVTP